MKRPSLLTCVLLDIAGYLTYLIPFLGEWGDGLWAPLSAFLFYRMFGGRTGKTGAIKVLQHFAYNLYHLVYR
jgi:hypothetical protein